MVAFAERDGHDAELWGVTGLLHDADYERFSDMDDTERGHPRTIIAELESRDAPPEMVHAIAAHADFLGVPAETELDRTLLRRRRALRLSRRVRVGAARRASTA